MVVLEGSNTVLVGYYSFTYSDFRRNGCVGGFQYRFCGHRAVLFPHTQMARTFLAQFSVVIILFDVICFCVMKGGK